MQMSTRLMLIGLVLLATLSCGSFPTKINLATTPGQGPAAFLEPMIVADGRGGYLRAYRAQRPSGGPLGYFGVEHCRVDGGRLVCRDLRINLPAEAD